MHRKDQHSALNYSIFNMWSYSWISMCVSHFLLILQCVSVSLTCFSLIYQLSLSHVHTPWIPLCMFFIMSCGALWCTFVCINLVHACFSDCVYAHSLFCPSSSNRLWHTVCVCADVSDYVGVCCYVCFGLTCCDTLVTCLCVCVSVLACLRLYVFLICVCVCVCVFQ